MITIEHTGNFKNTDNFFKLILKQDLPHKLRKYGEQGVEALREATPKDTGLTSLSWSYEISTNKSGLSITWSNANVQNGVNIALILQYGHLTRSGAYVQGVDYINPALRPVFQEMAEDIWKEVIM